MSNPFDKPSDGTKISDQVGRLLILTPTELREKFSSAHGETDVVVADMVVVDESNPTESQEFRGCLVFQKVLCAQLRPNIGTGRPVLGRLEIRKAVAGSGKKDAYVLKEASADEVKTALVYWETKIKNPFAAAAAEG